MEKNIEPGINSNSSESIVGYNKFYAQLQSQEGMLIDSVRTFTYYKAIAEGASVEEKTVLDVGTGSGILSLFAAHAGAKKVYAIEASDIAYYAQKLIDSNNYQDTIVLLNKKVEDIKENEIEKVDILISEPLGVMLVHERMLDTYIIARDRFLKEGGKMIPSSSTLYFMPFCDETLYNNFKMKVEFWNNSKFLGVDLTSLYEDALSEKMKKVVIGPYNPKCHVCDIPVSKYFDFTSIKAEDLLEFSVKLEYKIPKATLVHGIGCWFDAVLGEGIILSTSPSNPVTHWYQSRLLLKEPLAVNKNQTLKGELKFKANREQSYFVYLRLEIEGTSIVSDNHYHIKDSELYGFDSLYSTGSTAV